MTRAKLPTFHSLFPVSTGINRLAMVAGGAHAAVPREYGD